MKSPVHLLPRFTSTEWRKFTIYVQEHKNRHIKDPSIPSDCFHLLWKAEKLLGELTWQHDKDSETYVERFPLKTVLWFCATIWFSVHECFHFSVAHQSVSSFIQKFMGFAKRRNQKHLKLMNSLSIISIPTRKQGIIYSPSAGARLRLPLASWENLPSSASEAEAACSW